MSSRKFPRENPLVIAHRGSSGIAPENTMAAFQQAVKDGAEAMEFDIVLSKDEELVVIHDDTLERTTNGAGAVDSKTLAELKQLDAGYHFSTDGGKTFPFRGQGVTIPTLEEVFTAFPSMLLHVEIKLDSPVLVRKLLALVQRFNRLPNTVILMHQETPGNRLAKSVRNGLPGIMTGHSAPEVKKFVNACWWRLPRLFKPRGPAMHVPEYDGDQQVVTRDFIRYAHGLGMEVHVWTVNHLADMRRLLNMGVDGLYTDYPARMRKLLQTNWRNPKRRG